MSTLINTVGTSPMIVSEVFQYVKNIDEKLKNIALIYTSDKEIEAGVMAVTGAVLSKYPDVHLYNYEIDIQDIEDQSSFLHFLDFFAEVVKKEKEYGPIYLNVSGGRKVESIALSIYAGFAGVKTVYNVIHRDVRNFNDKYERIKDLIMNDFGNCNSEEAARIIYNKRSREYDPIFFPNPSNLVFLEISVLNMPESEKEMIRRCIEGIHLDDTDIEDFRIKAYADSGFITFDRHRTYATELGNIILKML